MSGKLVAVAVGDQLLAVQHQHGAGAVGQGAHAGDQLLGALGGDGDDALQGNVQHQIHGVHLNAQLVVVVVNHDQDALLREGLPQAEADVHDGDNLAPHVEDAQDPLSNDLINNSAVARLVANGILWVSHR